MKKFVIIIVVTMTAALSMVGCKSNRKATSQEPATAEIQQQKQALADTVLATIDSLFNEYSAARSQSFLTRSFILTDAEKMVKPDYLLDPSFASETVTKSQKVNALAIYFLEQGVRKLYDMPCEDVMEAITKLATELNLSMDIELITRSAPVSEKLVNEYNACKESGEVATFWQFQYAIMREYCYVLAEDPFFFDKITEEQYFGFKKSFNYIGKIVKFLAPYDEEIKQIADFLNHYSEEEWKAMREECSTFEKAKKAYKSGKVDFVEYRNALLR